MKIIYPNIDVKDFNIKIQSCNWCTTDGNNFGDMITPYIYKKIIKTNIVPKNIGDNILLGAGSILNFLTNKNSIVWGSGLGMKELINKVEEPKTIISVCGLLTYNELNNKGIKCPKIFGDPGLILQKFYNPTINKKYILGIIPHWIEYNMINKMINNNNNIVINLQDDVEKVIDLMLSCNFIMSTSLHGIIVSHAYKIPCMWIRFPDNQCKIKGGYFKFLDYYSSLEIYNVKPVIIDNNYFNQPEDVLVSSIKDYPNPENYILNKLIYNTLYLCPIQTNILVIKNEPIKKYVIYTSWLKSYLTKEPFFFVKNLELFGWEIIELSDLNIEQIKQIRCIVLCVTYDDFDISLIKCDNIQLIYKIDDLYPYKKIRNTCIENADIIISPYQYLFNTDDIKKCIQILN